MRTKKLAAPASEAQPDAKLQRAVQSVEVGGRLLLTLAEGEGAMNLKDLAALAGLTPSRAHPYLVSYGRLGLVEQDASGRYDLGPAALKIGLACLQRLDPLKAAEPAVLQLAAQTGHAVALSVWGNFGPTVVRLIEARQPLHVALRVGSVLSLFDTATGRAFASAMPDETLRQAIAGPLGKMDATGFDGREAALARIREEMRQRGVARAVGSPIPGVNAFSAPVFDMHGRPVLAITVTDHQDRLSSAWENSAARAVAAVAGQLTRRLSGQLST
ncbi:MAG: IclR family transcriptional regulator [Gammaproteobacteria bacterium]